MPSAALLSILLSLLCCVGMLLPGTSCPAAELEILAAGDTTPGMRMLEQRPDALFSPEALARITAADAFLWNCETSGPSTRGKDKPFLFRADAALLAKMALPNGIAVTANNHVFDGLAEGAANLLALLDGADIRHNGLYTTASYAPLRLSAPEQRPVYLLCGSPIARGGSGPYLRVPDYSQLLRTTIALRREQPQALLILFIHDGTESQYAPDARQRQWADMLAWAGADVLLFAHSHRYGLLEVLHDTPRRTLVAWSLGNFLFGGNRRWRSHRDVRILSLRLNLDTGSRSARWLYGYTDNWTFFLYQ
ncbi:CapA family protein [uncultured Desulfovibrio sp.]|uniref:CapA family protein n=1 Tax=uncultured Desulfovibrio sp. TaxID=167968 RepID=UPI002601B459|nr:CapA family protein [uncultured Desulfovibrio sp.]